MKKYLVGYGKAGAAQQQHTFANSIFQSRIIEGCVNTD